MSNRPPCSRCGVNSDVEVVERGEKVMTKSKEATLNAHPSRLFTRRDEFEASSQLDTNLDSAQGAHAHLFEAPSPEALVSLRARYNASQKAFGAILGFGELTMNGYESGGTPDSTNRLLLRLAADPYIFKAMYDINSSKIGALQRKRIEESEGFRCAREIENQKNSLPDCICAEANPEYTKSIQKTSFNREAILKKLCRLKKDYERDFGLFRIGVLGSVAMDEADETSNLEIVVELRDSDFFRLANLKDSLLREFGRPVVILSLHKPMNKELKERIQREAVYA